MLERDAMTESSYVYRLATPADAEVLLAIYAPYVETSITFECTCPTVEEFRTRIEERYMLYPYIVCEYNGTPVGYAYASRLFAREAYDWSVELSVYMDMSHRGRGLGRAIYAKLLDLLAMQGVRTAHGKVTFPNEKSDRLHRDLGFELVGTMHNVGFKLGQWRDVNHYEKYIGNFEEAPKPVVPICELDAAQVAEVLER